MSAHAHAAVADEADPAGGLHAAFDGMTKVLASKVAHVIAQQLARRAAGKTIEKKVAAALPALVEQAFIDDFLVDEESARRRRAILTHALSRAELRSTTAVTRVAAPRPSSEPPDGEDLSVTSAEAAKLLHVSRTHLNMLADTGRLGRVRRTAGGHRRIPKAAVLEYKTASKERQSEGLDAMVEASQRLGLYDQELADVVRRRRR